MIIQQLEGTGELSDRGIAGQRGVNISLPSLRIDAFSLDVMSKVQDVKKEQSDLCTGSRIPETARCDQ